MLVKFMGESVIMMGIAATINGKITSIKPFATLLASLRVMKARIYPAKMPVSIIHAANHMSQCKSLAAIYMPAKTTFPLIMPDRFIRI